MKIRPTILPAPLLRLKAQLSGNSPIQPYTGDEPPLRSELFSAEQMEQHGKTLRGCIPSAPGMNQTRC